MSTTWVVGGTSGIGEATAKMIRNMPGGGHVIVSGKEEADVRSKDELFAFLGKQKNDNGQIDQIVYSAGITELDWLADIDTDQMLHIYEVNVVGLINVLQMAPSVRRVVVVGSDAAWREMRTSTAYCASKAALHQAVRCIARERASDDFQINVVAPGMTEPTKMQEYVDVRVPIIRGWTWEETAAYEQSQTPMGRRADVSEIATVIVSLLYLPCNYLNGAIIPVNGGR